MFAPYICLRLTYNGPLSQTIQVTISLLSKSLYCLNGIRQCFVSASYLFAPKRGHRHASEVNEDMADLADTKKAAELLGTRSAQVGSLSLVQASLAWSCIEVEATFSMKVCDLRAMKRQAQICMGC